MNHFTFPQQFQALYDKAVGLYAAKFKMAAAVILNFNNQTFWMQ